MDIPRLQTTIDAAWDARDRLDAKTKAAARKAVIAALDGLDTGALRVAHKRDGRWHVEEWLKKAVLLSFRLTDMQPIAGGPGGAKWWTRCRRSSPAGAPPN